MDFIVNESDLSDLFMDLDNFSYLEGILFMDWVNGMWFLFLVYNLSTIESEWGISASTSLWFLYWLYWWW